MALSRKRAIARFPVLEALLARFTPGERLALYALAIVLAASVLALLLQISSYASETVPVRGGTLTEGEVGPARFINPVLALSGADEDLTELVYSGLMRARPDGSYVPDLASSYDVSSDGTVYTFHLRPGATFQDGTPVTSADVLFTISLAQNPDVRSPREADWVGVTIAAPDAETVQFTLPHAYAPFIEDTTMGILPKHLWQDVSAKELPFNPLNTHPVGSGPYRIANAATDATGAITRYDLVPFEQFALGAPYLKRISFLFYPNEDAMIQALNQKRIDAVAGISPDELASVTRADLDLASVTLPRVFGVFFNQNHAAVLADASVRAALNAALDKQAIVDAVLGGYGTTLDGPVPPNTTTGRGAVATAPHAFSASAAAAPATTTIDQAKLDAARAILEQGGWSFAPASTSTPADGLAGTWTKKSAPLRFTIATADEPELVATAKQAVAAWRRLGVDVTLQVYPLSEFNNTVLRPRDYDAILFGEVVGRSLDLFAFWHSSQRNDPGLNLAMYTNSHADEYLSEARAERSPAARAKLYAQFAAAVEKDQPAVFLYAPQFLYLVPTGIHGVVLGSLTMPADRFLNAYQWYANTTSVWSIFTSQ